MAVALFICIALSLLTPPFFTPDGSNHAQRGFQIANGRWIPRNSPAGAGGFIDSNLLVILNRIRKIESDDTEFLHRVGERVDGRISEAQIEPLRGIRWSNREAFSVFANSAVYAPVLYLPAAAGWRLGQAADLTILHTLRLARWLNLLFAIAIGWAALRVAGRERWILFALLLLPTLLSLAASPSEDALITPLLVLAMVLIMRATASQRRLTRTELLVAAAALAAVIAAKPPYLPMALLLFLPALELGEIRSRKTVPPLVCAAVIAAIAIGWQKLVHPFGVMLFNGAVPAVQTAFLKAHPAHVAMVVVSFTVREVPLIVAGGVDLLGPNSVVPSKLVFRLFLITIAMIFLLGPHVKLQRWSSRVLLLVVLCTIVGGLSLAGYIFWTPPMANMIDGLQARYYLPLAPVAIVLGSDAMQRFARWRSPEWSRRREKALLVAGGVFLLVVLYTPWLAAHRFYRLGLGTAIHDSLR